MDSIVGQKVYVKGNVNRFKLLSYSGEVVFIDKIKQLVLVRFRNNETAFFSEANLSLEFILPPTPSIIFAVFTILFLSYSLAYFVSFAFAR